jgi:hypothetical protein
LRLARRPGSITLQDLDGLKVAKKALDDSEFAKP